MEDLVLAHDIENEAMGEFEALPKGKYALRGINASLENSKNKAGVRFIKVEFEVTRGTFERRKIFQVYNVIHSNKTAVAIALRDLASWYQACTNQKLVGELRTAHINQILGAEFVADVDVQENSNPKYSDTNTITKYYSLAELRGTGNQQQTQQVQQPVQQQTQQVQQPVQQQTQQSPQEANSDLPFLN